MSNFPKNPDKLPQINSKSTALSKSSTKNQISDVESTKQDILEEAFRRSIIQEKLNKNSKTNAPLTASTGLLCRNWNVPENKRKSVKNKNLEILENSSSRKRSNTESETRPNYQRSKSQTAPGSNPHPSKQISVQNPRATAIPESQMLLDDFHMNLMSLDPLLQKDLNARHKPGFSSAQQLMSKSKIITKWQDNRLVFDKIQKVPKQDEESMTNPYPSLDRASKMGRHSERRQSTGAITSARNKLEQKSIKAKRKVKQARESLEKTAINTKNLVAETYTNATSERGNFNRYNRFFHGSIIALGGSLVLMILATGNRLQRYLVQKVFLLADGTTYYDIWSTSQQPVNFNVYIYNVTNPEEILNGIEAKLEEIGPVKYVMISSKRNIILESDDGITNTPYVEYQSNLRYEIAEEDKAILE